MGNSLFAGLASHTQSSYPYRLSTFDVTHVIKYSRLSPQFFVSWGPKVIHKNCACTCRRESPGTRLHDVQIVSASTGIILCLSLCTDTTLTPDDLGTLLNELHGVIDVWFRFGVQLKVPVVRLNAIKREHMEHDDCLMHMLIFWLSNATPSPTWQTVVDALCCASVGRPQIAENIRRTYCNQDNGVFCPHNKHSIGHKLTVPVGKELH